MVALGGELVFFFAVSGWSCIIDSGQCKDVYESDPIRSRLERVSI